MTLYRAHAGERDDQDGRTAGSVPPLDVAAVLGAVRDDVRQTLRTGWLDPGIEAASNSPVFFTAAWSAIRPNVGKSFLVLARKIRSDAVEFLRAAFDVPDLRKGIDPHLSEEEVRRVEESARAAHLAGAKAQIVVHALYRAVRRERIAGTGREEPPIRRGVPEWQRWMSFQPAPGTTQSMLAQSVSLMTMPSPPMSLRLLARWPSVMTSAWDELGPLSQSPAWNAAAARLRRIVLAGIGTLPHPVDLQWAALQARGFGEEDRVELASILATHDAAMPSQTLAAAFAWLAFGAPEIGVEG